MKNAKYFSASWCGPCKMFKPVVNELIQEGHPIEIIDVDENNYLQKMRNGKIYIEKQLLKKYIRSIREIIDIRVPRNKILEILKRNGYNPNRALVELANYRVSHNVSKERLPKDKYIMIEPSAFRIPKKEDSIPVRLKNFK